MEDGLTNLPLVVNTDEPTLGSNDFLESLLTEDLDDDTVADNLLNNIPTSPPIWILNCRLVVL